MAKNLNIQAPVVDSYGNPVLNIEEDSSLSIDTSAVENYASPVLVVDDATADYVAYIEFGGSGDVTNYYTKAEVDERFLPITGGEIKGHLLPNNDNINLGSIDKPFSAVFLRNVYAQSLYENNISISKIYQRAINKDNPLPFEFISGYKVDMSAIKGDLNGISSINKTSGGTLLIGKEQGDTPSVQIIGIGYLDILKTKVLHLPSNGKSSDYTLFVGSLGDGSDIPSIGGGSSVVWENKDNNYGSLIIDGEVKAQLSRHGHTHAMSDVSGLVALQASHDTLRTEFDNLKEVLNEDVEGKINTWNEVVDFLDKYSDSEDLATILSEMNEEIAKKALGSDLDTLATRTTNIEEDYLSKSKGGTVTADVTIKAALKMNTLYLPSDGTMSDYTLFVGSLGDGSDIPSVGGGSSVVWENKDNNYGSLIIDGDNVASLSRYGHIHSQYQLEITATNKLSYSLLKDVPTIPSAVTESIVSGWGFTKNTGTITGIKMNGKSVGTSGNVDLGTVITEHQDLSGYQTKITSANKLDYSLIIGTPTSLPASDVYPWAKAATKPSYTAAEVGALATSGGTITGAIVPNENTTHNLGTESFAFSHIYTRYIASATGFDLRLCTGETQRMHIVAASGNVMIGTMSDNGSRLRVAGNIYADGYRMPTTYPTDPVQGEYYLYIGSLGDGSNIPSSGGGGSSVKWSDVNGNYGTLTIDGNNVANLSVYGHKHLSNDIIDLVATIQTQAYTKAEVDNKITTLQPLSTAINTGNIGSQSVAQAQKIKVDTTSDTAVFPVTDYEKITAVSVYGDETPIGERVVMLNIGDTNPFGAQIAVVTDGIHDIGYRKKGDTAWKLVAFTDSNVASATRTRYIETQKPNSEDWYGNQYRVFARWASDNYNILEWATEGNYPVRVDIAKKLNTPRTIWGQSFDGSGNVDGDITINISKFPGIKTISSIAESSHYFESTNTNQGWAVGTGVWAVNGFGIGEYKTDQKCHLTILKSSGNVGIGTTNPTEKLMVGGNITPSAALTYNLGTSSLAFSRIYGRYFDTAPGYDMRLCTGGAQRMHIVAATGNVMIGTESDNGYKLRVAGNIFASGLTLQTAANKDTLITINGNANTDSYLWVHGSQYTIGFGVGSGNVNRGLYDLTNNHWWISKGASDSDTYIYGTVNASKFVGNIEASSGSISGNLTASTINNGTPITSSNIRSYLPYLLPVATYRVVNYNSSLQKLYIETIDYQNEDYLASLPAGAIILITNPTGIYLQHIGRVEDSSMDVINVAGGGVYPGSDSRSTILIGVVDYDSNDELVLHLGYTNY